MTIGKNFLMANMIKNDMIWIESIRHDQIEELRVMRNNPEVWKYLSNPREINEVEQEKWFETMSNDVTKQYFGIMIGNFLVGCIWYDEYDQINASCRIGIFVNPRDWGQGVAQTAITIFIKYLFAQKHIHRIWFLVMDNNKKALHLYKKLGFKKEGVQHDAIFREGKWHDYIMMYQTYGL